MESFTKSCQKTNQTEGKQERNQDKCVTVKTRSSFNLVYYFDKIEKNYEIKLSRLNDILQQNESMEDKQMVDRQHINQLQKSSGNEFIKNKITLLESIAEIQITPSRMTLAKRLRQQKISSINKVDIQDEHQQELVIEILQEEIKTPKDITFLKKIVARLPLFEKNPQLMNQLNANPQSLFKEFSYQKYQKHEIIFNCGSVFLLIPKLTKSDNRQEEIKRQASVGRHGSQVSTITNETQYNERKVSQINAWGKVKENLSFIATRQMAINPIIDVGVTQNSETDENSEAFEQGHLKKVFGNMNLIKTFFAGEAFGEISLITKQRRTGTMICREETHLMALTKNGFETILGQYHEKLKADRMGFLQNFTFFEGIPTSLLLSILLDIKIEILPSHSILFQQGNLVDNIYFLKHGCLQLSKILDAESQNSYRNEDIKSIAKHDSFQKRFNKNSSQREFLGHMKSVPILRLADNSNCGLEDFLEYIENVLATMKGIQNGTKLNQLKSSEIRHSMTAQIISEEAEVYTLNKEIFLNNLQQSKTLDIFVQETRAKLTFINSHEDNAIRVSKEINLPTCVRMKEKISSQSIKSSQFPLHKRLDNFSPRYRSTDTHPQQEKNNFRQPIYCATPEEKNQNISPINKLASFPSQVLPYFEKISLDLPDGNNRNFINSVQTPCQEIIEKPLVITRKCQESQSVHESATVSNKSIILTPKNSFSKTLYQDNQATKRKFQQNFGFNSQEINENQISVRRKRSIQSMTPQSCNSPQLFSERNNFCNTSESFLLNSQNGLIQSYRLEKGKSITLALNSVLSPQFKVDKEVFSLYQALSKPTKINITSEERSSSLLDLKALTHLAKLQNQDCILEEVNFNKNDNQQLKSLILSQNGRATKQTLLKNEIEPYFSTQKVVTKDSQNASLLKSYENSNSIINFHVHRLKQSHAVSGIPSGVAKMILSPRNSSKYTDSDFKKSPSFTFINKKLGDKHLKVQYSDRR